MWIVLRDMNTELVTLIYHNLQSDQQFDCGKISAAFDDYDVMQWIFNNADNLTPGDFIRLSNGQIFHWDGRAFDSDRWNHTERACA
jgi:hypothetical protein